MLMSALFHSRNNDVMWARNRLRRVYSGFDPCRRIDGPPPGSGPRVHPS